MNKVFRLKNGDLSMYALACGYIQAQHIENYYLELYCDGCYHVKLFHKVTDVRIVWLSFDELSVARATLNTIRQAIKKGR